jgi:hypothetical protein
MFGDRLLVSCDDCHYKSRDSYDEECEEVAPPTPPVSETASSAATVNKLPNPILEPSEELTFSDNVLKTTLKLINPTEREISFAVRTSNTIGPRYTISQWHGTVGPKEAGYISFTL